MHREDLIMMDVILCRRRCCALGPREGRKMWSMQSNSIALRCIRASVRVLMWAVCMCGPDSAMHDPPTEVSEAVTTPTHLLASLRSSGPTAGWSKNVDERAKTKG